MSEHFFFFKQRTAYEIRLSLVGSEMWIRDGHSTVRLTTQRWVGSVVLVLNEMVLVLVIDAVGSSRSRSTSTKIPVNYAKQNCNASSRTT